MRIDRKEIILRVGLLTGGGDCPGLNAVIRAVVRKGERHYGDELAEIIGRKVDFNTPTWLSKYFRGKVLREAIAVYERT